MSKYYVIGGFLCIGGLFMMLYQAISSLMTAGEIIWQPLIIMDVIDAKYIKWIDNISIDSIQGFFQYILSMNLSMVLIVTGIALFIIGGFVEK